MKVLIDPGHGIDTRGKQSPGGLFREYLWNRQIADLVVDECHQRGIDASLVVTETNDIPLKTRCARINRICDKLGKENVLLVSVHSNAAGDGSKWMEANGWSAYTTKGKTRSDELAECMYDAFQRDFPDRRIRKDYSDGDRDWEENFYVLSNSRCPAVLLENFFYDNLEECRWLLKEENKVRIARAIVGGLLIYLSEVSYE